MGTSVANSNGKEVTDIVGSATVNTIWPTLEVGTPKVLISTFIPLVNPAGIFVVYGSVVVLTTEAPLV